MNPEADPTEPVREPLERIERHRPPADENAVLSWARAVWGGLKDTAREVVDEGRKAAQESYDEGWDRFDAKTKFRRKLAAEAKELSKSRRRR